MLRTLKSHKYINDEQIIQKQKRAKRYRFLGRGWSLEG